MKAVVASTVASVVLVTACASPPPEPPDARSAASPQSTALLRHYRCESGATVAAAYPTTDSATVHYGATSHEMRIAISGSGARYVGDGLEWWTKGFGAGAAGTMFRHRADGTTGEIIERCAEY